MWSSNSICKAFFLITSETYALSFVITLFVSIGKTKSKETEILVLTTSTYTYRAPQWMSPRRNWDSPTHLAASECALPTGPKGGVAHSPAAKGGGGGGDPNPATGEKE